MYYEPLKSKTRKLSDNVLIASTPFVVPRLGRINLGARMSLFHYDNQVIVWAAFPYVDDVEKCLRELTGKQSDFNVTHLIIPNYRHNMGAQSFKEKFPNLKIIGPDKLKLPVDIDITIPTELGNKVLKQQELKDLGMDEVIYKNFEFVFLPYHKNKDIVLYDKNLKYIFEADVDVTIGPVDNKLEQYCPETGCDENYSPHWGYYGNSFLTRFLHPGVGFFKGRINKLNGCEEEEGREGVRTIYGMDFTKMVRCHGNVEDDGKASLRKFFDFLEASPKM